MRLIKEKTKIDFLSRKRRNVAVGISILIVVLSIASMATRGLNLGIDFTGGFLFQVQYPQAVDLVEIRQNLTDAGFGTHVVQDFGTDGEILVRLPPLPGQEANAIRDSVFATLSGGDEDVSLLLFANVSAQVGEELT
ncbi:MAG: protein translocase subunit SecF, partial [Woeseiaceae bacterium]